MKIYIELGHCIIANVVEEDCDAYNQFFLQPPDGRETATSIYTGLLTVI